MIKYYNGEMYRIPQAFEDEVRADERAKAIEEYRKEMQEMIEGDDEFTDWQKHEILECNELVAEQLKESEE